LNELHAEPLESMTEVKSKFVKGDLPLKDRKRLEGGINLFWARHVASAKDKNKNIQLRWQEFAKHLKQSLDDNLEPHWHVLVGIAPGFACKNRLRTAGIWKLDECSIVVWKSPGIEEPATTDPSWSDESHVPKLKVIEPATVEKESEMERVLSAIRAELPRMSAKDGLKTAQVIRRRLTSEFGTIWHVVSGQKIILEKAANSRNAFQVSVDELRVFGFQHEQSTVQGLLNRIEWSKLLQGLPYLLVVMLCFVYMLLSALCKEGAPEAKWAVVRSLQQKCYSEWETDIAIVGAVVLSSSFFLRKMKWVRERVEKKLI